MRLTDRVLSLHPVAVTILFVLLFVGGGIAANIYPLGTAAASVLFSVSMLLLFAPVMLWHYSLYRAASDRNLEGVGHNGRRAFFFALSIAALSVHLVLYPLVMFSERADATYRMLVTVMTTAMVVGCLSSFAAIWAAANALTRFDDRSKSTEFHKTLGTFILEFYLPIGIWVIYPRIKRLLAAPLPT
jgi:hypothetical protein